MSKHKQGRNRTSRGYLQDIQITLERASVGHHFHHASATTTDITSHTASQTISLSPAHPTQQINVVVKPYRGLMFVQIPVQLLEKGEKLVKIDADKRLRNEKNYEKRYMQKNNPVFFITADLLVFRKLLQELGYQKYTEPTMT